MLRKSLLILTAALGLTMSARANMWDNRAQSNDRYGKPFKVDEANSLISYSNANWMITEWFDETGWVESIGYYKLDGKGFTKDEIKKIQAANNFFAEQWRHIAPHVWVNDITDQRFEQDSEQLNGKTIARLILCTHKGYDGMNAAFQNVTNNPSPDQTKDNPKVAL
jgi:hypothetical protein